MAEFGSMIREVKKENPSKYDTIWTQRWQIMGAQTRECTLLDEKFTTHFLGHLTNVPLLTMRTWYAIVQIISNIWWSNVLNKLASRISWAYGYFRIFGHSNYFRFIFDNSRCESKCEAQFKRIQWLCCCLSLARIGIWCGRFVHCAFSLVIDYDYWSHKRNVPSAHK